MYLIARIIAITYLNKCCFFVVFVEEGEVGGSESGRGGVAFRFRYTCVRVRFGCCCRVGFSRIISYN